MPAAGSQIACNPRTSFERPESLLKAISTRWIPIWAPCVRIRLGFKSIAQSRAHFDLRGRTEASIPRRGCTPRTKHGPRSLVKPLCSVFGRDARTARSRAQWSKALVAHFDLLCTIVAEPRLQFRAGGTHSVPNKPQKVPCNTPVRRLTEFHPQTARNGTKRVLPRHLI
jgi:hypothetical protein